MHSAGYKVAVTHSPSNTKAKDWVAAQKTAGRDFSAFAVDVADFDSCKACIDKITKDIGPVDILVNNAGITRDTTFRKMTKVDWDAVIRANLDSIFNMTKQVMDGMVDRGWVVSSTCHLSMAPKELSDKRTIRPPRRACMASPRSHYEAAFVTGANIAINGGQHMQ